MTQHTAIEITGPYDLREIALMGFGHRDEKSFDGVMRMAFCLDGGYERAVGVAARQDGDRLSLEVVTDGEPLSRTELGTLRRQVARVVSLDHDGAAFDRLCQADPALAAVHARAPGFRPALFYSPYEAAVWSIVSARRARSQGIGLRTRLAEQAGTAFDVAGVRTFAVPSPSRLLAGRVGAGSAGRPDPAAARGRRGGAGRKAGGGAAARAAARRGPGRAAGATRHRAVLQLADR